MIFSHMETERNKLDKNFECTIPSAGIIFNVKAINFTKYWFWQNNEYVTYLLTFEVIRHLQKLMTLLKNYSEPMSY